MESFNLKCTFNVSKWSLWDKQFYTCFIKEVDIPVDVVLQPIGAHMEGKSIEDVIAVSFNGCTFEKFPQNLTKTFPNMTHLELNKANLKKIEREDLKDLGQVTDLWMRYGKLELLPGDLLQDMKNLQVINFDHNQIKCIGRNFLDGLNDLRYFSIKNNNDLSWDSFTDVSGEMLEQLKKKLNSCNSAPIIDELNRKPNENEQQLGINRSGVFFDVKRYLDMQETKDFTITIDDNKEFKVHKFILAARSPTLAEMIKNNPDVKNLNITVISDKIFEKILDFIYTDRLPDGNFKEIFLAAEKLKIESLRDFAVEKLVEGINGDNAFEHLVLGNKLHNVELKRKSFIEFQKLFPDHDFDDELMDEPEKLQNLLAAKKKVDDAMKEVEKEVQKLKNR